MPGPNNCVSLIGREVIVVDGKVNLGSGGRCKSPITLINAWTSRNRLLLGQLATEAKSNEITAVAELLKGLVLKKSIVTVDAMNCQKETVAAVIEGGGDYSFALKAN